MSELADYEKLASFYLGKRYQLEGRTLLDEKVLYDAKDLTTHALCVGMTGSGKTGLCLSLLEEAALDGIPAICVDPKGDIGNLLLTFPEFRAEDFAKWVDPGEARRKQMDVEQFAAETAEKWEKGLAGWDQDGSRVRRFKEAVDIAIYTPGSNAGIPMSLLKSFDAPPQAVLDDNDVMRERVAGAASGLLTLMGIDADPLSSKEHILLSNIFDNRWRAGKNLDLAELIRAIQDPGIDKIGVFDLESFFPASERMKLAMQLNNLLASPTFSGWLEGQPLNIKQLLFTSEGKPRLSIISIAHLSDQERMFFVTILLNELLGWMRTQPGTSSLRALFYMDEIFGYFPPTAKPPSKPPMMVLLKQARAFGLGIALATQNPVDLDYKGLANIGTWFLGRLQTQRDKERVLEGLEGAAAQSGTGFDHQAMEETLAALGSRVFLMNNVHDSAPTIFQTRWAMSYLRGPLSRLQIQELMDPRRAELTPVDDQRPTEDDGGSDDGAGEGERPIVPSAIDERFCQATLIPEEGARSVYRPGLLAEVSCHYVRKSADLDDWIDRTLVLPIGREIPSDVWSKSRLIEQGVDTANEPDSDFRFADVPGELLNAKAYKRWDKDLRDHLYRHVPVTLYECKELKRFSRPDQDELDARLALKQVVREKRDAEQAKLKDKYVTKVKSLDNKIRTAKQRLEREKAQYDQQKWSSMLSIGQTVLGAFLGNKVSSRAATAGRSAGRAAQQHTDVVHARETLEELHGEKEALEAEFHQDVQDLTDRFSVESLSLTPVEFPCRKGDLKVHRLALLWIPWQIDADGIARDLCEPLK